MEFCEECDGLLVPKKDKKTGKMVLVCQICGKVYPAEKKKDEYELKAEIKHKENEKLEVVTESDEEYKISEEEREELLEQYRETLELFEY